MTIFGAYYRSYFAQQGLFNAGGCADAAHVSFYSDSDQRTVETGKSLAAGMFPGCPAREQSETACPRRRSARSALPLHGSRRRPARIVTVQLRPSPAASETIRPASPRPIGRSSNYCSASFSAALQLLLVLQPGHSASKLLLEIPASLEGGKGDHPADLKGPLNTASTITENFLLEYAGGMPMDQVGWGRVDLATLKQLMDLHTAASDLTRRSSYLAITQASNALAHIMDTLKQASDGQRDSQAPWESWETALLS